MTQNKSQIEKLTKTFQVRAKPLRSAIVEETLCFGESFWLIAHKTVVLYHWINGKVRLIEWRCMTSMWYCEWCTTHGYSQASKYSICCLATNVHEEKANGQNSNDWMNGVYMRCVWERGMSFIGTPNSSRMPRKCNKSEKRCVLGNGWKSKVSDDHRRLSAHSRSLVCCNKHYTSRTQASRSLLACPLIISAIFRFAIIIGRERVCKRQTDIININSIHSLTRVSSTDTHIPSFLHSGAWSLFHASMWLPKTYENNVSSDSAKAVFVIWRNMSKESVVH